MSIIKQKEIYDDSKKVFDNLNKELVIAEKNTKELTAATKALQKSYRDLKNTNDGTEAKNLTAATDKLTTSTKKLKNALTAEERVKQQLLKENVKLANSRTKAAKDLARVRQETLKNNKANRDNAKSTLKMNKGLGGLAKSLLGTLGVVGGMMAFVSVLKNAFKISVTFGKESSKLAAILKKEKKDIKELTEQAKELGATTAFTASEVIKLQTELAKLGFSLKEIEASTPGILALAAATGSDLAPAAALAGATLRIFNLDASEMGRVTDVLAKSTTISSLSMEKLATIMPVVGKTAQIAGVSLERTAALAGTLTDRGLDASTAGTALRNIFLKLAKDGRTWDGAMQEMNGSTDKLKTSIDLFGVRASAAGIILSETEADVNNLTTSLNDATGAAQEMADTMLDNLAGDITKANSAWEGFILSLADGEGTISRVLRKATSLFTNLLTALTELNDGSTLFESKFKRDARSIEFLAKATKKYNSDLKELTTNEEKLNFIHSESTRIKQKLRGNTFALSKAEKELADANFFNKGAVTEKVNQLKFNNLIWLEQIKILDKLTPSEKKQTDNVEDNTEGVKKNTKALRENNRARSGTKQRGEQVVGSGETFTRDDPGFGLKLGLEQSFLDEKQRLIDQASLKEKQRAIKSAKDIAQARAAVVDAAFAAAEQFASDIFAAGQDAKLARIAEANDQEKTENEAKAESDKEILRQQLEDGLITEIEFKERSLEIDENLRKKQNKLDLDFRKEQAKAEKKKALFDIAMSTGVAIVRQIALMGLPWATPFIGAIIGLAGIQAAAVLSRPLPKFGEGGEIEGNSHDQGGVDINAEGGEYMLRKSGYKGAENISEMINKGLIKDEDIGIMQNSNNYSPTILQLNGLINKFDENIKNTHQTNEYLKHMYSSYENNGMIHFKNAHGKESKLNKIN